MRLALSRKPDNQLEPEASAFEELRSPRRTKQAFSKHETALVFEELRSPRPASVRRVTHKLPKSMPIDNDCRIWCEYKPSDKVQRLIQAEREVLEAARGQLLEIRLTDVCATDV